MLPSDWRIANVHCTLHTVNTVCTTQMLPSEISAQMLQMILFLFCAPNCTLCIYLWANVICLFLALASNCLLNCAEHKCWQVMVSSVLRCLKMIPFFCVRNCTLCIFGPMSFVPCAICNFIIDNRDLSRCAFAKLQKVIGFHWNVHSVMDLLSVCLSCTLYVQLGAKMGADMANLQMLVGGWGRFPELCRTDSGGQIQTYNSHASKPLIFFIFSTPISSLIISLDKAS